MQSSNLVNIGIKPSLFTDKTGEFSFCKDTEKSGCGINSKHHRSVSRLCLYGFNSSVIWHRSLKCVPYTSDLSQHTFHQSCCADLGFFKHFKSRRITENCDSWSRMQLLISAIEIMSSLVRGRNTCDAYVGCWQEGCAAYRVYVFQLIKIWQFLLYAFCQVNQLWLQNENTNKPVVIQNSYISIQFHKCFIWHHLNIR